jgi:hypothetical protein
MGYQSERIVTAREFKMGAKRAGLCCAALAALSLSSSSGFAQQPPGPDCRRVSKVEYDSAKRYYLLRTKFGAYVRTGHFWRRYYWYCRS